MNRLESSHDIWKRISLIVLECHGSEVTEIVEVCIPKTENNWNSLIKLWLDLKFTRNTFQKKMLNSLANSLLWGWRKRLQKSIQLSLFYKLTVRWLRNNKFPLNCSFILNLYSTIWKNIHRSWWIFYYYLGKSLYECIILTIQKKTIRTAEWLNGTEKNLDQTRPWWILSDFLCVLSAWFLGSITLLY